jgi:tetratricopeptide (TPR) repeat protein
VGDYDRAISELQPLISKGTSNIGAYANLSWLLADAKHDYSASLSILLDASSRFPNDTVIANNLAYVHLMLDRVPLARVILQRLRPKIEGNVALTATWGLLHLKEGNQQRAREFYETAAHTASQMGNKKLAATVRQKMHLEFARSALSRNEVANARREVELGLRAEGRADYKSDLLRLQKSVFNSSS